MTTKETKTEVFSFTQALIEDAETSILKHQSISKPSLWASRQFIFPAKYLMLGASDVFLPFFKWSIMSLILLTVVGYLIKGIGLPVDINTTIMGLCIYIPMALVIFSVPSTYAYYGVKDENIRAISEYLSKNNISDVFIIELIEENLEKIYIRVLSRVSTFKWVIASLWAFLTFILNLQMKISIKASPNNWESLIQENMMLLGMFAFISFIAIGLVISYKRASDLLFKSIEFGLVEFKYQLKVKNA